MDSFGESMDSAFWDEVPASTLTYLLMGGLTTAFGVVDSPLACFKIDFRFAA
jgi:hypothetical protein